MLKKIKCKKFRQEEIVFNKGLNVVLGDNDATNSIGKSTLLMVIDLAFGGETFYKHNKDVFAELGHHEYFFFFEFGKQKSTFIRSTEEPKIVYKLEMNSQERKSISLDEYKKILKENYFPKDLVTSFREFIGLFSRIWGKDNLTVSKPLHIVSEKSWDDCLNNLLKFFNQYRIIQELNDEMMKLVSKKKAFNKAFSNSIVTKINKTKYDDNKDRVEDIKKQLSDIKEDLSKHTLSLKSVFNREVLDLKKQKDSLLSNKLDIESRLDRVNQDLKSNKYVSSKTFESINLFFPNINKDRVSLIEEFHSKVSKILKKELTSNKTKLEISLKDINSDLKDIDSQMSKVFKNKNVEDLSMVVDRIEQLSFEYKRALFENEIYDNKIENDEDIKEKNVKFQQTRLTLLNQICDDINCKIEQLVFRTYNEHRKSPTLKINASKYEYEIVDDTGTGKAYSNLVLFDLAIFDLTELPILIHDSTLFKNIENKATSNIIKLYNSFSKQIFISIDEIKKYDDDAIKILIESKAVELGNNKLLYTRDWRKKDLV